MTTVELHPPKAQSLKFGTARGAIQRFWNQWDKGDHCFTGFVRLGSVWIHPRAQGVMSVLRGGQIMI